MTRSPPRSHEVSSDPVKKGGCDERHEDPGHVMARSRDCCRETYSQDSCGETKDSIIVFAMDCYPSLLYPPATKPARPRSEGPSQAGETVADAATLRRWTIDDLLQLLGRLASNEHTPNHESRSSSLLPLAFQSSDGRACGQKSKGRRCVACSACVHGPLGLCRSGTSRAV